MHSHILALVGFVRCDSTQRVSLTSISHPFIVIIKLPVVLFLFHVKPKKEEVSRDGLFPSQFEVEWWAFKYIFAIILSIFVRSLLSNIIFLDISLWTFSLLDLIFCLFDHVVAVVVTIYMPLGCGKGLNTNYCELFIRQLIFSMRPSLCGKNTYERCFEQPVSDFSWMIISSG